MPVMHLAVALLIFYVNPALFAKAKKNFEKSQNSYLAMPPNGQCLDSLTPDIRSIHRQEGRVFQGVSHQGFFISTPFNGIKKEQSATFGEHKDSQRVALPKELEGGNWQGLAVIENKLVMLDGELSRLALFSLDKLEFVHARSIAWDAVKPARDAKGEPPKPEIQKTQRTFKDAYYKAGSEKFTGMAFDAGRWLGSDANYFFVATNLAGFPLVTLKCSKEDLVSCYFDRTCFVEGLAIPPGAVAGLALDIKNRKILLADKANHAIHTLAFNSCFDSRTIKATTLDKKIRTITSISIDTDHNLWLSTNQNDDYNNASAYVWTDW